MAEPETRAKATLTYKGETVELPDMTRSVRLDELSGGAAVDLFSAGLREVLANIADEATQPDKTRAIVLTVELTPNEDRSMAAVGITMKTKLAPSPVGGLVYLGRKAGRPLATENKLQASLFEPTLATRQ